MANKQTTKLKSKEVKTVTPTTELPTANSTVLSSEKVTPQQVTPNDYTNLYNAYEQAMNDRTNAYVANSNAMSADAQRQLAIVGNQSLQNLYANQGVRGQEVSQGSILANDMSTGKAQSAVKAAYENAAKEVAMQNESNIADTGRAMGNQQVEYNNSLADLKTQSERDIDDLYASFEQQDKINDINARGEYKANEMEIYAKYGGNYTTIKAYNKAIKQLKTDGDVSNDWKIQYLEAKRDALQADIDEQKLAQAKNNYSASLSKYTTSSQVDKQIRKILTDGDTSNDWKLTYLNKYRALLKRQETAAKKKASSSSSSNSKTKSKNIDEDNDDNNNNKLTDEEKKKKENAKKKKAAKKALSSKRVALDSTNVWNPYYWKATINKK